MHHLHADSDQGQTEKKKYNLTQWKNLPSETELYLQGVSRANSDIIDLSACRTGLKTIILS